MNAASGIKSIGDEYKQLISASIKPAAHQKSMALMEMSDIKLHAAFWAWKPQIQKPGKAKKTSSPILIYGGRGVDGCSYNQQHGRKTAFCARHTLLRAQTSPPNPHLSRRGAANSAQVKKIWIENEHSRNPEANIYYRIREPQTRAKTNAADS